MSSDTTWEIAATAARLVVEEGLEFGPAKHRALKELGLPARQAKSSTICNCFVPIPSHLNCWRCGG
jgi:hypothetical protein